MFAPKKIKNFNFHIMVNKVQQQAKLLARVTLLNSAKRSILLAIMVVLEIVMIMDTAIIMINACAKLLERTKELILLSVLLLSYHFQRLSPKYHRIILLNPRALVL